MNKILGKRFLAYIVDTIIVLMISSLLSLIIMSKDNYQRYKSLNEKYANKYLEYINGEISEDVLEDIIDSSYEIERAGITNSICHMVVVLAYFGIFQFVNNGQTIGKKILKIKINNVKRKELNIHQFIIRTFFNNRLISSTIIIVLLLLVSKSTYLKWTSYINVIGNVIYTVLIGMMLIRKDHKGLHDILAGTQVISVIKE